MPGKRMPVGTPTVASPEEFLLANRDGLIALDDKISYLCVPPMPEEDLRHYIQDTVTALPPAVREQLPPLTIVLVPFLEMQQPKGTVRVSFETVPLDRAAPSFKWEERGRVAVFFGTKDEEVSEFHYTFYHQLAQMLTEDWSKDAASAFLNLVKEELAAKVHGEIDEKSWQLKQALQARPVSRESRAFREYAKQAFVDTMTLYLHGICCDIDVETGPRQMPSRSVRKRLEALHNLYPPPVGHAVFPEELSKMRPTR